jgi:DNA uptake protein ComE-like DNA-binding protein
MKFESNYKDLTFYVGGKRHKFTGGVFVTDDQKKVEVLKKLKGIRWEEEKKKPTLPNLNIVSVDEAVSLLEALQGINEEMAKKIIELRPYATFDEIPNRVKGIGSSKVKAIQEIFILEG